MKIRRREFIAGLGSTAAWPVLARAQQGDRVRRIGWLMPGDGNNPVEKTFVSEFTQALADLGWTDGRNMRIDLRWSGGDINRARALAQELVGLQPDIIVTGGGTATVPVHPFIATQRSKRPSLPLGASREAGLLPCQIYSWSRIARRSYWRQPETR
jgi:hypothetical protein